MDLQEFQKHAKRTVNWTLSPQIQLANFGLGIAGEAAEIAEETTYSVESEPQKSKIIDECGDVCFYVANLCTALIIDWTDLIPPNVELATWNDSDICLDLFRQAGKIADVIKKTIAQGHELDIEKLRKSISGLMEHLKELLRYFDITLEEVCEYNHLKLLKRYPHGFEVERSIKREN